MIIEEGTISDTNHLGSFKTEKELVVKEKLLIRIQTKDPAIAFVTSSAVTEPLNNPEMCTGFALGFVIGVNNTVYNLNLIG